LEFILLLEKLKSTDAPSTLNKGASEVISRRESLMSINVVSTLSFFVVFFINIPHESDESSAIPFPEQVIFEFVSICNDSTPSIIIA
jgi:hypothetical protein